MTTRATRTLVRRAVIRCIVGTPPLPRSTGRNASSREWPRRNTETSTRFALVDLRILVGSCTDRILEIRFVLEGELGERVAAAQRELDRDIVAMMLDGPHADRELTRDLAAGQAVGDQLQDAALRGRQ